MTAKATVCTAVAVLIGLISNASAGEFYPYESQETWLSVDAATADLDDSTWTNPTEGSASVDEGSDQIVLDTDLDDPLVYENGDMSSEIAIVKARIIVSPNEAMPTTSGLADAQAALTTVTNADDTCLYWYGLVGSAGSAEWVRLAGDLPEAGEAYDIIIALDNRAGQKKIRYSVKGPGDGAYTNLQSAASSVVWLDNPKDDMTSISAVAFSGVGRFGDFSADSILDDGTTIDSIGEVAGFDFKDGKVTAVVTVPSAEYSGKTAVLSVVDFATGNTTTYDPQTLTGEALSWDLSNLTPGGTYSYTVTVKDGGDVRTAKSGTFTAANWGTAGSWFSVTASGGAAVNHNGIWEDTYLFPAPTPTNETQLSIYGDASFLITDKDPGTNAVSRVDTKYQFETFVSTNALITTEDAVSGIVAATNDLGQGAWYVYKTGGWTKLDDSIEPAIDTSYIMRAEFDFLSATKRVRYLLSADRGASFTPLTLSANQWIDLVNADAKTSLSSVSISGKGILDSIKATVADPAVAEAGGVRYATLWDAVNNGTGAITLLTNATLAPGEYAAKKRFQILPNGYEFKYDNAASEKWWLYNKGDYWYLRKIGGFYIFQ